MKTAGYIQPSKNECWETPQDLFDRLDAEFDFDTDVCALPHSAKCANYYTPEDDGLAQVWGGVCWMNPPYGKQIKHWVCKADQMASSYGTTTVALLPVRTDAHWWHNHVRHHEVRFIRGRVRFTLLGVPQENAPFASAIVVFGRPPAVKYMEVK
jgi:phage N-6-adenine-methyltransferase